MILGMTTATYTLIHVIISLVGIASGLVVAFGLMGGKRPDGAVSGVDGGNQRHRVRLSV